MSTRRKQKTARKSTRQTRRQPAQPGKGKSKGRRWSRRVMQTSNALDLEEGVFTQRSSRQIALSLKRSAERSRRRKADPFRSAMSMLNFHINRAGKGLSPERRRVLNQAKDELRKLYHRAPRGQAQR